MSIGTDAEPGHSSTLVLPVGPRRTRVGRSLIPSLTAGLVTGLVVVTLSVSFAMLIFSGPLASHLPTGIGLALFSAALAGGVVALASSYPGTIAFPQDKIAPILALVAAAIAAGMPAEAGGERGLLTVVAALGLVALLNALFLTGLGMFRLGSLIRYIPYPVIGGFLAGTGWLLVRGSFRVMAGRTLSFENLPELVEPGLVLRWLPGVAVALTMYLCMRRWRHFLTMPLVLLAVVGLFYLALATLGWDLEYARKLQLLPARTPGGGRIFDFLTLRALAGADWGAILEQAGTIATVPVISAIGVLLNSSGLELAAGRDIDLDRELKVAGAANVGVALGSGITGFHALSLSSLVLKMGVNSRLTGITSAGVCAALLVAGAGGLAAFFPVPVLGGLLMFLGLSFLIEWVWDARHKTTRADYTVIMVILATVGAVGYLQGVGLGIGACIVLFAVNYSRVSVVRHAFSGAQMQSNVDRPAGHVRLLREHGQATLLLSLQGYLFFGTSNVLLTRVRERTAPVEDGTPGEVEFVVLDFGRVHGADSSTALSFAKMRQLATRRGFRLLFAGIRPKILQQMAQEGFPIGQDEVFRIEEDADHALQWCEDRLLERHAPVQTEPAGSLLEGLAADFERPEDIGKVLSYFERQQTPAEHYLIRQGDRPDNIYLLERGSVTARLQLGNGREVRLRRMGAGSLVGEAGMYLGAARSASIVTNVPSVIWRLSADALARMEQDDPSLALAFHRFMARRMAGHLTSTNSALRALLD